MPESVDCCLPVVTLLGLQNAHSWNASRMMLQERIESLDDLRLDAFRSLKSQNAIRDARLFVAEGPTVVERVLRSGFEVQSLLISDRKFASFESRLPNDVRVYRLRNELAEELIGFSFHCGVLASVVRRPALHQFRSQWPAR